MMPKYGTLNTPLIKHPNKAKDGESMSVVSPALKQELLKLKKSDLTVPFLVSKISKTTKVEKDPQTGKKQFHVKDAEWDCQAKMKLKAGEYINKEDVDTTLGSFLVNKLLIEDYVESVVPGGYYNEVITAKKFEKLVNLISTALLEGKLPLQPNVVKFIQAFEFYGLMLTASTSPAITPGLFSVDPEIRKKRDEMFAKTGDNPSLTEAVHIEDSLVKEAEKKLKGDPGMALFDSAAKGSFDDSYKMMSIMIGAVKNPNTGKYDMVKSNYIDGLQKEDLTAVGNSIVNGAYPKAIGTAEGGYLTKQFYAVFQSIVLDEPGSDCGSKGYLPVFLTDDNYNDYMWQYAVVNGKTVLLTNENRSQFVGKKVNLRSPIGCIGAKLCNKCMGERFYKLGIKNVGLTTGRISNSIMNASLKNFHNTKVKLNAVDPDKLLI
jgi:hypothetical protein